MPLDMRPVDPPYNLYQIVGQLASKSGPAATWPEIIYQNFSDEGDAGGSRAARPGQPQIHGSAMKFRPEMLVALEDQSMLK